MLVPIHHHMHQEGAEKKVKGFGIEDWAPEDQVWGM
jgi:hypothetical protein